MKRAGSIGTWVASLAVAATACASPSASSITADPSGSLSTTPASSPNVSAEATFECPEHGGSCLGPIGAGTYTTRVFAPPITYTVADGWVNGEDLPGNFLLQMENDPRYVGIYRDIAAPHQCDEAPEPGVGQTPNEIAAWLTNHEGLVTTEPEPVSVGGLSGVFVDISFDPAWTATCPFSNGQAVVPFIVGGGTSSLHHVILPGFDERLYLLEFEGGNVAIEIGPEGESLEDYLTAVEPILESLEFGS